jgi:hypothetical protein
MMKHVVRLASLLALFALWSPPVPAQTLPEWIALLRDGGHVIVFRHGATYPDQADTDPFNLANVDKQRQLNDAGRQGERNRRGIPQIEDSGRTGPH